VSYVSAIWLITIIIIIIIIYFDSSGMAHKNNRQITIDNTSKYRKTDRHIVDR